MPEDIPVGPEPSLRKQILEVFKLSAAAVRRYQFTDAEIQLTWKVLQLCLCPVRCGQESQYTSMVTPWHGLRVERGLTEEEWIHVHRAEFQCHQATVLKPLLRLQNTGKQNDPESRPSTPSHKSRPHWEAQSLPQVLGLIFTWWGTTRGNDRHWLFVTEMQFYHVEANINPMEEIIKQRPAPFTRPAILMYSVVQLTHTHDWREKTRFLSAFHFRPQHEAGLSTLTDSVGNGTFLDCQELGTQNRIQVTADFSSQMLNKRTRIIFIYIQSCGWKRCHLWMWRAWCCEESSFEACWSSGFPSHRSPGLASACLPPREKQATETFCCCCFQN